MTRPDELHFEDEIDYTESVTDAPGDRHSRIIGSAVKVCKVRVTINLAEIIRRLGKKACQHKTGHVRDGYVTVKRVGKPKEVSRNVKE